jgi:hypothetical protein
MENISNIEQLNEALTSLGYETCPQPNFVAVKISGGSSNNHFTTICRFVDNQLVISCKLFSLADVADENESVLNSAALNYNSLVLPFSFATLSAGSDSDEEGTFVLIDSMPVGDLSVDELEKEMKALLAAILTAAPVIKVGLGVPIEQSGINKYFGSNDRTLLADYDDDFVENFLMAAIVLDAMTPDHQECSHQAEIRETHYHEPVVERNDSCWKSDSSYGGGSDSGYSDSGGGFDGGGGCD